MTWNLSAHYLVEKNRGQKIGTVSPSAEADLMLETYSARTGLSPGGLCAIPSAQLRS